MVTYIVPHLKFDAYARSSAIELALTAVPGAKLNPSFPTGQPSIYRGIFADIVDGASKGEGQVKMSSPNGSATVKYDPLEGIVQVTCDPGIEGPLLSALSSHGPVTVAQYQKMVDEQKPKFSYNNK